MHSPASVLLAWAVAFNNHDVDALAAIYAPDAINHQTPEEPVHGREAIRAGFTMLFREFPDIGFHPLNMFTDGEWAIIEWHGWSTHRSRAGDPGYQGKDGDLMHGCGFFRIVNGAIVFQRGYWDSATWNRLAGPPA